MTAFRYLLKITALAGLVGAVASANPQAAAAQNCKKCENNGGIWSCVPANVLNGYLQCSVSAGVCTQTNPCWLYGPSTLQADGSPRTGRRVVTRWSKGMGGAETMFLSSVGRSASTRVGWTCAGQIGQRVFQPAVGALLRAKARILTA